LENHVNTFTCGFFTATSSSLLDSSSLSDDEDDSAFFAGVFVAGLAEVSDDCLSVDLVVAFALLVVVCLFAGFFSSGLVTFCVVALLVCFVFFAVAGAI